MVYWLLLLTGLLPLSHAWFSNRRTTLIHAVNWCFAAWLAWIAVVALPAINVPGWAKPRYLALCLTGCAGVAVLGARRPLVAAWNFVVLALLAVMLVPLVEGMLGFYAMTPLRTLFLALTLAVGVVNYLPTRLWACGLLLAGGCAWEMVVLATPTGQGPPEWCEPGWLCVAAAPWAAYLNWRCAVPPRTAFDRLWWEFRNRYGLVWGQRVREQFNRAAIHAGWPVQLHWLGLIHFAAEEPLDEETVLALFKTLQALLKRFGPESDEPPPGPTEKEDQDRAEMLG